MDNFSNIGIDSISKPLLTADDISVADSSVTAILQDAIPAMVVSDQPQAEQCVGSTPDAVALPCADASAPAPAKKKTPILCTVVDSEIVMVEQDDFEEDDDEEGLVELAKTPLAVFESVFEFIFSHLSGHLTDEEMDQSFPVSISDTDAEYLDIEATGLNWAQHARFYMKAISWFEDLYEKHSFELIAPLFEMLTAEQKTILQRGFEIKFYESYPPLLDGRLYDLELEMNDDMKSTFDFPFRRIKIDPVRISIHEFGLDMKSPGTPGKYLH